MTSLLHLGEQRFSPEPGGYSFENWMNSFNLLLDDFEDHVGTRILPKSYFDKRFELTSSLMSAKNAPSDLDKEMSKLQEEHGRITREIGMAHDRQKTDREISDRKEKVILLEDEKIQAIELLENAKFNVAKKKKQMVDSKKLLRRFFGTSARSDQTPLESLEARVAELEHKVELIEKKILEQKKRIELYENSLKNEPESKVSISDLQSQLILTRSKLEELELKQEERSQLLEERREITSKMKDLISGLELSVIPATS
jgi:uncharacterized protein YeeX (DUF496 family)